MPKTAAERLQGHDPDRPFLVQRAVFALGMAVLPDHMCKAMRIGLDRLQGSNVGEMPYSVAKSMYQAIDAYVTKKGVRTNNHKLIVFDEQEGILRLTQLGQMAVDKLGEKIRERERSGFRTKKSGLIVPTKPPLVH